MIQFGWAICNIPAPSLQIQDWAITFGRKFSWVVGFFLMDLIPKISVLNLQTPQTQLSQMRGGKVWKFQLCLLCFDINTIVLTALRDCFSFKNMTLDCKKIVCFRSSGKDPERNQKLDEAASVLIPDLLANSQLPTPR